MNQIAVGTMMAESKGKPTFNENLIRHMIFNTLLWTRKKFHEKYGELVICYDSPYVWRKDKFPQYKVNRKKQRDKQDFDWNKFHDLSREIQKEIEEYFPYKVMKLEKCESDDIIAVLATRYHQSEKILIVSSDKDFQQLQRFPNVEQYSPYHQKMLKCDDPLGFLQEHIIRGDSSDGIPNILSVDTAITDPELRQKSITEKRYNEWMSVKAANPDKGIECITSDPDVLLNISRNRSLIDFSNIPDDIQEKILQRFQDQPVPGRGKIFDYFLSKQMIELIQHIQEF